VKECLLYFHLKNTFFDNKLFIFYLIKFKKIIQMNDILEILKYTIPALIVLIAAYLTISLYLKNEEKRRKFEITMNNKDSILPLRLQAYERLILFLERISPDSLIMRVNRNDLNALQLQNELLNSVRSEFEHNLAQQTYISSPAWEMVKAAKNNVMKLINESAADFKADAKGINLSKRILENAMELSNSPVYAAIEFLKKEVKELF